MPNDTPNATGPERGTAESEDEFELSPQGWQKRWLMEFAAARKELKKWHEQGEKIVKRYLDEREDNAPNSTRWNLFPANIDTLKALLYGKTPSVDVSRRYNDAQDDVARIAAQMLERLLNNDIEKSDDFAASLEYALEDDLLPGLGNVRLRYEVEFEDVPAQPALTEPLLDELGQPVLGEDGQAQVKTLAPAVPAHQRKKTENVKTEYVFWQDQLWSPARIFHDVRWWAFKVQMTRKQLKKRFPNLYRSIPLNSRQGQAGAGGESVDAMRSDPWGRADIWEAHDKETRRIFWVHEGMDRILDQQRDPLGLDDFWPFPRPMIANATTSRFVPRPDFLIAQDLYNEIDAISTRINTLQRAIKCVGLYDQNFDAIERLLDEACENELIPTAGWDLFQQGNGLAGRMALLPLDGTIVALDKLREYRSELIQALYQLTGMSDIMRGQAEGAATATEQAIKAKFGSVRVQRRQDEFARFATDVQRLRAEIICKHFDAETILQRSNITNTPDAEQALQAVELLKDEYSCYRVVVKPESVSLTDYAANKQEMTEVVGALGMFVNQLLPVGQAIPPLAPAFLRILQTYVARTKGGDEIEGILDEAVAKLEEMLEQAKNAPPQATPPDPKVVQQKLKNEGELQKTQATAEARHAEIEHEKHSAIEQRAADANFSIVEEEHRQQAQARHAVDQLVPDRPKA